MAIKVFYHICPMNHALVVVKEHVMAIHYSGLYEAAECIYCVLGGGSAIVAKDVVLFLGAAGKKFKIIKVELMDTSFERLTLLSMHEYVGPQDAILYLHSKGVTRTLPEDVERIEDWTRVLSYHCIKYHRECVFALMNGYDAAGPNYDTRGIYPLHFSGNMWWVRGDYFLKLPRFIAEGYLDPEFYVGQLKPKVFALHSTYEDHHKNMYGMYRYVDCDNKSTTSSKVGGGKIVPFERYKDILHKV
jgi:hypothetical protein